MNVTELYRELKMTKDEFFTLVQELGFDIGERAIKIDDKQAVKIIHAIRKKKKEERKTSVFDEETKKKDGKAGPSDGETVRIPDKISVKDLAELLDKRVNEMIGILMQQGIMATINESLDYETAAIILEDMGFAPELSLEGASDIDNPDDRAELVETTLSSEKKKDMKPRPPVVVIMGHVDHGKTTLLDTIRNTNVTEGESGGITQHIGAYQVEKNGHNITFIDTPGHEAFTTMRSRGARVADVAILVVAADDGVKPQTIEALHILQEAELPMVVAINKTDKPGADIERVKGELSELNVIPEDYGGDAIMVPISAKNNENIDGLLENILLVADVHKEDIMANPKGKTVGSIIESHVDKNIGAISTILVQNGTLTVGDIVQVGSIPGKIRSLTDWKGDNIKTAPPSTPVQVLGLKSAPVVGDILQVVEDKKVLKNNIKKYDSFAFLQQDKKQEDDGKERLNVILRADTLGSLEAIIQSLHDITHEEVTIDILQKGLGSVTENDIHLAHSADAHVLAFHTGVTSGAEKYAVDEEISLQKFNIIYELIDYCKEELEKMLSAKVSYNKVGSLKVLAVFKTNPTNVIIGGRVEDGKILKGSPVKIVRKDKMIGEGTLDQLQKDKKNVSSVTSGSECGLRIDGFTDVQEGDIVENYEREEQSRSLED